MAGWIAAYFYKGPAKPAAQTNMHLGETKTVAMTTTSGRVQWCTDKPMQPMPASKTPTALLLLLGRLSQAWLFVAC